MLDQKLNKFLHENQVSFIRDISLLVAQPSVSARSQGIDECAELVRRMTEEIGADTRIIKIDSSAPIIYGEVSSTLSKKTILFYNHYDVQPEEPLEKWESPPFKPEVRGEKLYGRGTSDDKGELVARLKVVESFIKVHGQPPCNIKFCFEGEEETGSLHLNEYIGQNQDLFRADAVIWEGGGAIDDSGTPIVTLGLKGMLAVEFILKTISTDAHSMYAPVLPSAPWKLVRMLSLITNKKGEIMIPEWNQKIRTLTDEEVNVLNNQPFNAETILRTYGVDDLPPGMSNSDARKALVDGPTANISGIWAGYTGPGIKSVLPAEAHCRMDFRLASDQDPKEQKERLRSYLDNNGFKDIQMSVISSLSPARTNYRDPFVKAAVDAGDEVFQRKTITRLSDPGSGPMFVFRQRYEVPVVSLGISHTGALIHAPNEHIRLDLLENGMLWIARTISNFASM